MPCSTFLKRSVKGWNEMSKDKRVKTKSNLSSMQAINYAHEFKVADRAGGYIQDRQKNSW